MSFSGIFESSAEPGKDATLLGVPYDAGSTFRPGCRRGPGAIRDMAESLSPCNERGEDLAGRGIDLGDLELPSTPADAWKQIEDAVGSILDAGSVPFVLGGDHAVTVPAFVAAYNRHPDLSFLVLDAHPDLYPDYGGDRYSHACVSHRLLDLDPALGKRMTQVGIRASNPLQKSVAEAHGVKTLHAWEVDDFQYSVSGPVYLSIDIDVLDPAHAPGCGNPVPGGLSTRQLLNLLRSLDVELVGVDLVEVNPQLDTAGITALAAARLVTEVMSILAYRSP